MADLTSLLMGAVGNENDYLSQNPFYTTGINIAKTPLPAAQDNAQAFFMPILQGLLSGGLAGYGKQEAKDAQYQAYSASPLLQALSASQNIGPVADGATYGNEILHSYGHTNDSGDIVAPEGWTPKIGQSDLVTALQAKQQADELKQKVTETIIGQGLKDGTLTPQQVGNAIAKGGDLATNLAAAGDAKATGENPRLSAQLDAYKITDPALRASLRTQDALDSYVIHRQGAKDPQMETKLRSEWVQDKLYQSAGVLAPLGKAAEDVAKLKTPAGDLGLVDILAKAYNPGGVIRPQFMAMIKDAQNPLNAFAGAIEKVMGGGSFNEETRNQMIDAIKARVNDGLAAAKMVADSKLAIAAHGGLDSENIIPKTQYDALFGGLGGGVPGIAAGAPQYEIRTAPNGQKYKVLIGQ